MDDRGKVIREGLVRTWKQGRVGHIEINRPERANAYNGALLGELNRARGTALVEVSRDVFHQRIAAVVNTQRLPGHDDEPGLAEVLLPRVVRDSTDMKSIRAITAWMDERFP